MVVYSIENHIMSEFTGGSAEESSPTFLVSNSGKNHAQIPSNMTGDVEGRVCSCSMLNDVPSSDTEHDTL